MPDSSSGALCRSCGLCCDGTLFGDVTLDGGDPRPPLEAAGIVLQEREGATSFTQPCAAFRDRCCQVYPDRPMNCRHYRCVLLKQCESGEVSWEEGHQKVARALALIRALEDSVHQTDPSLAGTSVADLTSRMPTTDEMSSQPQLRTAYGPPMLRFATLRAYLKKHFEPKSYRAPEDEADRRG
jgi:Fe-S-cluster containining protein